MMQSEFEKLIGKHVDPDDYRVIEYVYMYHPVINNVTGKKQIADLYKIGGMALIGDMVRTAKRAEKLENQMRELRYELDSLQARMEELAGGVYARNELDKEEA